MNNIDRLNEINENIEIFLTLVTKSREKKANHRSSGQPDDGVQTGNRRL